MTSFKTSIVIKHNDTKKLPHAIHITTANITDRSGALEMFSLHQDVLSDLENVLVDGGYSGDSCFCCFVCKKIINAYREGFMNYLVNLDVSEEIDGRESDH